MPISPSAQVHPTAVVSPEADLADGVRVGPFVVIEGEVRLGPGCVVKPHAHLVGPLSMGRDNVVFSGAVLGEQPQHLRYAGERTGVLIGDDNIFREHVTVHRGTTHSWTTRIGSHNFFMAHAHVAHDCVVGDHCLLANCALVGGHCVLEDNVFLSGNSAVHQFVRMGRLSLLSGVSASTKDVPPFIIQQNFNCVVGVNVVGMRRAGLGAARIDAVRRAYQLIWRQGLTLPNALAQVEEELGRVDAVAELVAFIRRPGGRGINAASHARSRDAA